MSESLSFSPGGTYFQRLGAAIDTGDPAAKELAKRFAQGLSEGYFTPLVGTFAAMGSLHEEIVQILSDFSGRSAVLLKYLPIDHIVLLIKFYVVQWCTLTDMTATMISQGYNLGIHEKDLTYTSVSRNAHVQKSELAGLLKRCRQELEVDHMNRQRNEIVHRGRITEKETIDLKAMWDVLHGRKYALVTDSPITNSEYDHEAELLTAANFALGRKLKEKYTAHYLKTMNLINDIVQVVADKTLDLLKRHAI